MLFVAIITTLILFGFGVGIVIDQRENGDPNISDFDCGNKDNRR